MKILIIDTYNEIHRAKTGFVKGEFFIIYNFFKNFKALVEKFTPNRIFLALEGYPKFRYQLYPDYKKDRRLIKQASSQDKQVFFNNQKDKILELMQHLPAVSVSAVDYESDDIINTLAHDLKDEEITIISNDHDYIQLLQQNFASLQIFDPRVKDFLVAPSYHYLTWKSLAGDKSDSIPGIISNKKAEILSQSPSELDHFLSSPENHANFKLNLDLINFRSIPSDELQFSNYQVNFDILKQEFEKMEFSSLLNEKYWNKFTSVFSEVK